MKHRHLILTTPRSTMALILALAVLGALALATHLVLAVASIDLFARWDELLAGLRKACTAAFLAVLAYSLIRYGRWEKLGSTPPRSRSGEPHLGRKAE